MPGRDPHHPTPDDPEPGGPRAAAGGKTGRGGGSRGRRQPTGWFGSLSQIDFDIDFLERVLDRRPDAVEVLRVLAELVSRKGLVQRAVELDRRLVELLPDDFLARYNLACSLARAGCPDEALDSLSRAILLGYDDLAHMEADPDLESLRNHPDFLALLGGE